MGSWSCCAADAGTLKACCWGCCRSLCRYKGHRCFGTTPRSSHPPPSDARGSPHTPTLYPTPHHPARSPLTTPGALCSLSSSFQISEAGGSQLHLRKLDGIFVALPVEPVNTLQRQRRSVGGRTFISPLGSLCCSRFSSQAVLCLGNRGTTKQRGFGKHRAVVTGTCTNPHSVPRAVTLCLAFMAGRMFCFPC